MVAEALSQNIAEIIVALAGLLGVIITALLSKKKQTEISCKLVEAELALDYHRDRLDFADFIKEWSNTHRELKKLLEETEIDRFIMFKAWNGQFQARWTTNIFQIRLGAQDPTQYVHFELDQDYVRRLKKISSEGLIYFKTGEIQDSAIKRVYEAERVLSSVWCHIETRMLKNSKSQVHVYCSFSSRSKEDLKESTITKCMILSDRLKGSATSFKC